MTGERTVADAVGATLFEAGVQRVFGVVGSGNFHVTNALVAAGAQFVAARHEGGAMTMADAYSRISQEISAVTVHQGCGLTNTVTGLTEAAKSRTPLVVITAEVGSPSSNFAIDQVGLAQSVGALAMRVSSAESAVAETRAAVRAALDRRRPVVLGIPLPLQGELAPPQAGIGDVLGMSRPDAVAPSSEDVAALADAIRAAHRPVFLAGRGARTAGAKEAVVAVADHCGALLATSAVGKGLFAGQPWTIDVSGGFASDLTARLIHEADLIVAWGASMNMWTTRHGRLISPGTVVAQVDSDTAAFGAHQPTVVGVTGDVELTARALRDLLGEPSTGYRSGELAESLSSELRWRDIGYDDTSTAECIDPRTLSIALDDLLPAERVFAVDSGNFMGYPTMYWSVPDEQGFCFTQSFQSIGLGLATAIGAALARPDRLPVAALGDGGAMMGISELDTVVRLGLPMVIVIYDDEAYGAEVHHFGPEGHDLSTVVFPPTDIASIARGFGFEAHVVRGIDDLEPLRAWLAGPRDRPILLDAKVVPDHPAWWLEEAFRGH